MKAKHPPWRAVDARRGRLNVLAGPSRAQSIVGYARFYLAKRLLVTNVTERRTALACDGALGMGMALPPVSTIPVHVSMTREHWYSAETTKIDPKQVMAELQPILPPPQTKQR